MADKFKMTLEMSSELNEMLERIAEETASTKSEVVRKALALMQAAHDAKAHQQSLAIVEKDNRVVTRIVGL